MLRELVGQLREQGGEALRAARLLAVNAFDASRSLDERGKVLAQAFVVLADDEVNQLGQRLRIPALGRSRRPLGLDLLDDGRRIEPNVTACVAETLTTAAAEIEAVPEKDQGRGRVLSGHVAEGLVGVNHHGGHL